MAQRTITVLAGAGASKAVDPKQYPTTVEFFEQLPEDITINPLFMTILEFLRDNDEDTIVDVEFLLWRLDELAQFCSLATDQDQLTGWLLNGPRLANAVGMPNANFGSLLEIARRASLRGGDLRDAINEQVYKLYAPLPRQERLEDTWIPLLLPLLKSDVKLEVVTTNYDVILEAVLDTLDHKLGGKVDTGWRGTIQRTLDPNLWSQQPEKGLLTKLHGSVNWTRDGDQIYISDPTFKGSHTKHVIIYPGFKGRPSDPVFQAFHSHFRNALARSEAIVFIGFAFRDDHINELCERYISERSKVVVIDPRHELELPFDHPSALTYFIRSGFCKDSASDAVDTVLGVTAPVSK